MRAEFLIRVEAQWDGHWQTKGKKAKPIPPADHYRTDTGMDELLESIQHDEVCADGRELIVHDVSMDLGRMPRIIDGWLAFEFHYDVENEEAKSLRELQKIALDGMMFWCDKWINNIMISVVETKHI
jgi:hypothetical protein